MFDIGFSELVVLGLITLIVLGPKRLPEVARTAGRWLGQLRRFITDVKQDLNREIQTEELAELRKLKQELSDTRRTMERTSGDLIKGFSEIPTDSQAPTIHADESPKRESSGTAGHSLKPKRPRTKSRKKSPHGKSHGGK